MSAYWAQWSYSEIIDVSSVNYRDNSDEECEEHCKNVNHEFDTNECPQCLGRGCNYCLMCER